MSPCSSSVTMTIFEFRWSLLPTSFSLSPPQTASPTPAPLLSYLTGSSSRSVVRLNYIPIFGAGEISGGSPPVLPPPPRRSRSLLLLALLLSCSHRGNFEGCCARRIQMENGIGCAGERKGRPARQLSLSLPTHAHSAFELKKLS